MKKSDAQKIASELVIMASTQILRAADTIGNCNAEAMSDGMVRESIRLIRKLHDIARQVNEMGQALDWDVSEDRTVAGEKVEGEKVE